MPDLRSSIGEYTRPDVSIICVTYNHASFIRNALDSFLMQKGVSFEAIIADDASVDGTSEIVREYAEAHPNKIIHLLQSKNVGVGANFANACDAVRGKYVAICDGDDYFLKPTKLKRQYDLLESDKTLSACFGLALVLHESSEVRDYVMTQYVIDSGRNRFTLSELMNTNFLPTCSIMYRWCFDDRRAADVLPAGILPIDYYLHLLHASQGDIAFMDEVTAVYRRHADGMWADNDRNPEAQRYKHGLSELKFHIAVAERLLTGENSAWYYKNRTIGAAAVLLKILISRGDVEKIRQMEALSPSVFKDCESRLIIG